MYVIHHIGGEGRGEQGRGGGKGRGEGEGGGEAKEGEGHHGGVYETGAAPMIPGDIVLLVNKSQCLDLWRADLGGRIATATADHLYHTAMTRISHHLPPT